MFFPITNVICFFFTAESKNIQKEKDKSPETKLKVTEYFNLTDREFKVAIVKKLNEI